MTQATRNANDGISVAQTTEDPLNEINTNLQRIRELTVQAQNGSNTQEDRDSIQVGARDGETIDIQLTKIDQNSLGLDGFNVNGKGSVANRAATADDLTLAGFTKGSPAADGSINYTSKVNNKAATGTDVINSLSNSDTVTYSGTNTGLGVPATSNLYTADGNGSFTFDATAVKVADIQSYLTPNAGDSVTATIEIEGNSQEVNISSDGTITTKDGETLYLDTAGNLTQTGDGAKAATLVQSKTASSPLLRT